MAFKEKRCRNINGNGFVCSFFVLKFIYFLACARDTQSRVQCAAAVLWAGPEEWRPRRGRGAKGLRAAAAPPGLLRTSNTENTGALLQAAARPRSNFFAGWTYGSWAARANLGDIDIYYHCYLDLSAAAPTQAPLCCLSPLYHEPPVRPQTWARPAANHSSVLIRLNGYCHLLSTRFVRMEFGARARRVGASKQMNGRTHK